MARLFSSVAGPEGATYCVNVPSPISATAAVLSPPLSHPGEGVRERENYAIRGIISHKLAIIHSPKSPFIIHLFSQDSSFVLLAGELNVHGT